MSQRKAQVEPMNAMADISAAKYMVTTLEDAEAQRQGYTVEDVRPKVARKVGVAPGTLRNIRKLRTKVVPNWLMARIRAAFVAELQAQIQQLEHEISIHLQIGTDPRCDDLAKAQATLEAARALLNGGAR